MAAYIVVFAQIKDRKRFMEDYAGHAAELVKKYGGEYLVRTPKVEPIEGGFAEGASSVISKWPNREAIEKFWNSPEYQRLKETRQPMADCHVFVVEDPQ
jgi:uncharacterized protein (DUF1330 family)